MKSFLDLQLEVLSKDADAGTWIDDFIKSDDPKFAGKSKEKRKQMALAAYYAAQKNEGVKQVRGDDSLQYEEVELDEASRAETGELFKSLVNKAHASSEAGNHTQAKRHLANAQTARYGILAKHVPKHQASFDKYKELKHSYTNSDEPVREETELDEAHKINDKVEIVKGSSKGITGHIGEIRHGAFKGAPKEYTVYHGEHGATRVSKEHIRKLKEDMNEDISIDEAVQSHKVGVTVSDPNHQAVSQRKDKIQKSVIVKATDKGEAQAKAEAFYKKKGYKVHDSFYHSVVPATSMKTEEAEQIDELSNKLLNRYSKKAEKEAGKNFMAADRAQDRGKYDKAQAHMDKADKRASGVYRAQSKIKEESLDEISKDTLSSYAHKAFAQGNDLHYDLAHSRGDKATDAERQAIKNKISKRNDGVIKAAQKLRKEDMDEAVDTVKKDASGKVIAWSHEGDWEKMSSKNKQGSGKAANLAGKALKKTKELAKEEVEEIEEDTTTPAQKLRAALDRHTEKAVAANKAGDDDACKVHQGYINKIKTKMGKLAKNEEIDLAEMEALCELDKKTLGSYISKSHDQLMKHTGSVNMKFGRGDKDAVAYSLDKTALRKTANRTKGMDTAISKLTKEEVEEYIQTEAYEQLDELDKDTLKSYVNKAAQNARIQGQMQMDFKHKGDKARNPGMKKVWDKMSDDARSKGWKRQDGIKTAVNKLTKEDTETMLTYSEFMAQLAEGKADDLIDKLAADRERRLDKYDYSKEKDNKVSPVKQVKGHSYGAGEDSEEGEDDVKTAKPVAAKRGRGRPAGSKSGARV